jgi:hypothetical protein
MIPKHIVKPCEGVTVYRNAAGAANLVVHHDADPLKNRTAHPEWLIRACADYPGGTQSIEARQEYGIDFEAELGKLTYGAFDPNVNVVPVYDIPGTWEKWAAFDFGNKTACLLFAQDLLTQRIVVFGEGYWIDEAVEVMQLDLYEKLSEYIGVPMSDLRADDVLVDAVGDPSNPGMAREFGMHGHPISIRTKGFKTTWKLNEVTLGESRVNGWFRRSFFCCGKNFHTIENDPVGKCPLCSKVRDASPILTIMGDRCPNLIRTIPEIVRKPAPGEGLEAPEVDVVGLEDHLTDTLRYGCMRVMLEIPLAAQPRDILRTPSRLLPAEDVLEKIRIRAALESRRAEAGGAKGFIGYDWDGMPIYREQGDGQTIVISEADDDPDSYISLEGSTWDM